MKAQEANPFELFIEKIREIVRQEVAAVNDKPVKVLFTTKETAEILNVDESWLATKARAGLVPFRRLGHYRYFSKEDIEKIVLQSASGANISDGKVES